jgi:hypothetical protein
MERKVFVLSVKEQPVIMTLVLAGSVTAEPCAGGEPDGQVDGHSHLPCVCE